MIAFAYYLLKVVLCSGILFLYYHFALRNKLFHQWNRFYLLAVVLLSLTIPLLQFTYLHPQKNGGPIQLLQAVQSADMYMEEIYIYSSRSFSAEQWASLVYALISAIILLSVIISMAKLYSILRRHQVQKINNIKFIGTHEKGTPFSFFRFIFWNNQIDIHSITGQHIFQHELVHVKEGHTFDKLFIQIILVVFWCNPLFWLIRRELQLIHEFIADKKAIQQHDTAAFAAMILQAAYPHSFSRITNQFFQSSIKRRLAMLTKIQNPGINYLSRIIALPLIAIVFLAFTFRTKSKAVIELQEPITVVIDAGHGKMPDGQTTGAKSNDLYEDDIVLAIAKKTKALNANNKVNIVLTRSSDEIVDLKKRVEIAGEKKADLFISLHVNAWPEDRNPANWAGESKGNGFEVYVPNNAPYQEQSEIFGSVLQSELSTAYPTNEILLKRKTNIWVINKNVCPAVLLECGYITNKQDRNFITKEANQQLIAEKILMAIQRYAFDQEQRKNKGGTEAATMFASDEVIFSASGIQQQQHKPIIIINNKRLSWAQLEGKKITAKKLISYSKNDTAAIKKYGPEAKYGVLIFEEAQITNEAGTDTVTSSTTKSGTGENKEILVQGYPSKYHNSNSGSVNIKDVVITDTLPKKRKHSL